MDNEHSEHSDTASNQAAQDSRHEDDRHEADRTATRSAQQPVKEPSEELLGRLGTTLSPDLLVEALTHRSFSHEHPGALNYERLEFLGDAVLELVATETLYRIHPDMNEGQLAKMRAKAVSEEALSAIARDVLQVGPYILLGNGEAETGGAEKSSILCDIVESLIGATFIEHGIDEARKVVHHLVDDTLDEVSHEGPALDWKTSLTVKAHGMGLQDPEYRMGVDGPEFAQMFTARAVLPDTDEVLGTASGTSKRKAQLAAASLAWKTLDARDHTKAKHGKTDRRRHGSAHR
ncbi:ribonuclease III [Bifidobacterium mongoliense]|uniref:ribonuclease III n=1 Tax=Bifidobacterium mongoliense TaxID=518643 RepID=UPI00264722CF|nr:ribonuclease III [Bifidobacterium mongoliense]MDN5978933.1 ribonuclease III [Bifidobacterium mongoliense]MDN6017203.1 ribonuclease III [Bifidobacterium mongoliense]MDN6554558.1 ribonuclease III [Bifidobacterium mongoliense]MDN6769129.1 ribonuclease III [Bifidobacterium mongoliense]MDN6782802.1 ribonuclease III [Bifidobacterium mongoliense]